jgi:proteasome lid subunit RPN8/RPN11
MIRIDEQAWSSIVTHARQTYPNECCGALLGAHENGQKLVRVAIPMENVSKGQQRSRYELLPEDLLRADQQARRQGMDLIGIYHSHPDCDAYFSETDLENSCPWYSFVVLSIRAGKFDHANSWLPNTDQTAAEKEELIYPA